MTAVGLSIAWLVLDKAAGFRLYSVQSDSMSPLLRKGDLVLGVKAEPSRLKPGNVASYFSPLNPGLVITHRVVRIDSADNTLIMKGDNSPRADIPVAGRYVVGRTLKVIPGLGYVFNAARRPAGLITIIYLPAFLISITEIWLVAGYYRYRPY